MKNINFQGRLLADAGSIQQPVKSMVVKPQTLPNLSAGQLREITARLFTELRHSQVAIDKLTHENALLKRMQFAAQSERFGMPKDR